MSERRPEDDTEGNAVNWNANETIVEEPAKEPAQDEGAENDTAGHAATWNVNETVVEDEAAEPVDEEEKKS